MIRQKNVLVVITARGGSKGVPGKNVKALAGTPLIGHTIRAAKESKYVDEVIVSTDSEQIRDVSLLHGAKVPFLRPPELSGDTSKQEDAILHAMDWVRANDRKYEYVMVLVPTNPLRDAAQVDQALEFLDSHASAKSVVTVIRCEHHPLFANRLPADRSMKGFIPDEIKFKNRQELPEYFQISGSVCVADWDYFAKEKSFLADETYALEVSAAEGHDINSTLDFAFAEFLLSRKD